MSNRIDEKKLLLQGTFNHALFGELKKAGVKEAYVLEGRPDLEGAKLTTKHLLDNGIKPILISDNMAGFLFARNLVKEVLVAYQLIDRNGALCQIGGLITGVLAKKHKIPVKLFPNERKTKLMADQKNIFYFNKSRVAPYKIKGYAPLVEWVPSKYYKEAAKYEA